MCFLSVEPTLANRLMLQIVQLTSLRPTADQFCSLLRDALKAELQRGQMKAVKSFVQTAYSEVLVASGNDLDEKASTSRIEANPGSDLSSPYLGGLGLKFRYPGDPRK